MHGPAPPLPAANQEIATLGGARGRSAPSERSDACSSRLSLPDCSYEMEFTRTGVSPVVLTN